MTPLHWHFANFIMNRAPSDLYRMRNPQLDIVDDGSTISQKYKASLLPTNTGGRWGFIGNPSQLK